MAHRNSSWRPRGAALKPIPVQDVLAVALGEDGPRANVLTVVTGSATLHVRAETEQAALDWAVFVLAAAARELEEARTDAKKRQSLQMVRAKRAPAVCVTQAICVCVRCRRSHRRALWR
jgi:hypothetical protein